MVKIIKINIDKYKIIKNNNIKCTITKSRKNKTMEIIFNKIENYKNYDIIYSLKIVYKKDLIKDELIEEKSKTIALTESNSNISLIKNNNDSDKINIPYDIIENNFEDNFAYIEVIAQINDENNIEYIAYEPIKSKDDIKYETIIDTTTIIMIIFEIISIIIIICLILFLCYLKKQAIIEENKHAVEMRIKPLIKYDDIMIGKDEENDYNINKQD
jgi:hypothetical protein